MPKTAYDSYLSRSRTSGEELAAMGRQAAGFAYRPLFSLALIVSDPDEVWIKSTADSVLGQLYPCLELLVCDNGSRRPHVSEVLGDYADAERRVAVRRLPERGSRAAAYNAALSEAGGEFVALLEAGDRLAPEALFRVVESIQNASADTLYTDEDRVDVGGRRSNLPFKPYWSPDLLLARPYTGRLCVVRRELFTAIGGLREGFEGAEEHDLMLRLSERTDRILHLPRLLYHRRVLPLPSGHDGGREQDGPNAGQAAKRAVEEALARRGEDASVLADAEGGSLRVIRRTSPSRRTGTSVIVFVPEDTAEAPVLEGLEQRTSHPIDEVILANVEREAHAPEAEGGPRGGSTDTGAVRHPFPARALNLAASRAEGEYLIFLDGRSRVTDPGWLAELVGHAGRQGVGAVGCRLEGPGGGLCYGGSLVDLSRLVGRPDEPVFEREERPPLVDGPFNPLVVPAACLAVERAVFQEAEGFDDENLPTAFYDLDLCLRLRERGFVNVYTPYASLICEDRRDRTVRTLPGEEEVAYVWRRWWAELVRLLYYRASPLHATRHTTDAEMLTLLSP